MRKKGFTVIGLVGQSVLLNASHFPAPRETVACPELFYKLGGKGYNQSIACARRQEPMAFIGAVSNDI